MEDEDPRYQQVARLTEAVDDLRRELNTLEGRVNAIEIRFGLKKEASESRS